MKNVLAALLFSVTAIALAADRPIVVYSSYPVGSGPDAFVRQVIDSLSKQTSSPVVLENRPGGNGAVALASFNKVAADGHAILFTTLDVVPTMPMIYGNSELIKELKLLAPGFLTDLVLIAAPSINNIHDLQQAMKEHPLYGSWAIGSSSHLYGEQFVRYFKIQADHAAYKDFTQWYVDVSNQQLAFSFGTIASGTALKEAGRIKFLAIAAPKRDPVHPEIPTIDEFIGSKSGIAGPVTGAAFYINKNTASSVEEKLRKAVISAVQGTEVQQKISALNYRVWNANSKEINKTFEDNLIQYQQLTRQLNINLRQ